MKSIYIAEAMPQAPAMFNFRDIISKSPLRGQFGGNFFNDSAGGGVNDFIGLKSYQDGDDITKIDWSATASDPDNWPQIRIDRPKVAPTIWIAGDLGRHRMIGEDGVWSKKSLGMLVISSLLISANNERGGMRVGSVFASDREISVTKPSAVGMRQLSMISEDIRILAEDLTPTPPIEKQPLLSELIGTVGSLASRSIVCLVSDFRSQYCWPNSTEDNWQEEVENLANRNNKIIAIEIVSPQDFQMPEYFQRIAESPKDRLWTGSQGEKYRKAYKELALKQEQAIKNTFENVDAFHLTLRTDVEDWQNSLQNQQN